MKFLLDQDVYAATARHLRGLGHDAVPVAQIGLSQANDSDLLRTAQELGRILVTRDRDFGGLVFVEHLGAGVIYLRMLPSTQTARRLGQRSFILQEDDRQGAFEFSVAGRFGFSEL